MSRTFPRALFFCFRSLFVVFFAYVVRAGHDVHRRGHGRRRPLRGLSVASRDAIDATPARRRGGADRSLRRSAAATRLGVARGMDSNIGQVTGLASVAPSGLLLPHQNAITATSHQCGPCAPWSRASASACVRNRRVQGPSTKSRTKFEATTDATDAPRARPCSSWASSSARSRRTHRPRPAAARAGPKRRRAR